MWLDMETLTIASEICWGYQSDNFSDIFMNSLWITWIHLAFSWFSSETWIVHTHIDVRDSTFPPKKVIIVCLLCFFFYYCRAGSPDKITELYCLCSWFWTYFFYLTLLWIFIGGNSDKSECNETGGKYIQLKIVRVIQFYDGVHISYVYFHSYIFFRAIYKIIVITRALTGSTYQTYITGRNVGCERKKKYNSRNHLSEQVQRIKIASG